MNRTATTLQQLGLQTQPVFRDSYYNSTIELHRGTTVSELSLGHLHNDEVVELLRMRSLWSRH